MACVWAHHVARCVVVCTALSSHCLGHWGLKFRGAFEAIETEKRSTVVCKISKYFTHRNRSLVLTVQSTVLSLVCTCPS